jgi:hypothetical protein
VVHRHTVTTHEIDGGRHDFETIFKTPRIDGTTGLAPPNGRAARDFPAGRNGRSRSLAPAISRT